MEDVWRRAHRTKVVKAIHDNEKRAAVAITDSVKPTANLSVAYFLYFFLLFFSEALLHVSPLRDLFSL